MIDLEGNSEMKYLERARIWTSWLTLREILERNI